MNLRRLRRAPARAVREVKRLFAKNPDAFLRKVRGVVHVGANSGQEADLYDSRRLHVLWIEPIPEVFDRLRERITDRLTHRALQYLVTDSDDREYTLNVATNEGASSSIFEFGLHKDVWPHISYERQIALQSYTLTSIFERENIPTTLYDALVLDVQGAELLVLKGAAPLLQRFRYIKVEVADFEAYKGCCQVEDVSGYLTGFGFKEDRRVKFASHPDGGSCYDIVFKR